MRTPRDVGSGPSAGAEAEDRLGLLELLVADAVTADYPQEPGGSSVGSPRHRLLVTWVALGVAGFVIAVGFSARVLSTPLVQEQKQALIERIGAADMGREELEATVTRLRGEVEDERAQDLRATLSGRLLEVSIRSLELATGYTEVTGPGAVVTLQDAPAPGPGIDVEPEDEGLDKVLDSDVQHAVNGLWQAGAEAVAINEQRLSARSAIRSAAGAVLVNYRPLRPPYVVEAIGPPELEERFLAGPDAAELRGVAEEYGIGFTTQSVRELRLPETSTALPEEAEVVEERQGGRR